MTCRRMLAVFLCVAVLPLSGQEQEPAPRPLAGGSAFNAPASPGNAIRSPGELPVQSADTVTVFNCVAHLIDDIDVPAREAGQLVAMEVREGAMVSVNQLIARIDDRLARRQLDESTFKQEVANYKANDSSRIDTEARKLELYTDEYQITLPLYQKGSKTAQEFRRAQATMEIAVLELTNARNEKRIAEMEAQAEAVRVKAAQDSIERHGLLSPINGQVFEIFRQSGEWVSAGDKVLRVCRMDRLRVKGRVDGEQYDPSEIAGRPVTVTTVLARGRQVELSGQITFVALEKIGSSREFEVWAEVDNREENGHWQLLPGSSAVMTIRLR